MKFAIILALVSLTVAAPPSANDRVVTKEFFPETFAIYTAEHDIVDIVVPLNEINYSKDSNEDTDETKMTVFFVEADIKDNGEKEYKGVYVYKNGVAKKVLDNGQCSTYAKNRIIYFGASDGIYKYNEKEQTATKYGTVTANIVRMAVDTKHANVYYLTSNHVLYKFDEDEKVATKVELVTDARDMVIDFDGIMYYYKGDNQLYTYNGERVQKIEGLPAHPSKVELIRAVALVNIPYAVIDGRIYLLNADGTSEKEDITFQSQPTAFAPDALLYQYYAYKQKLYMYNLISVLENNNIEELSKFFDHKEDQIKTLRTMKVSARL